MLASFNHPTITQEARYCSLRMSGSGSNIFKQLQQQEGENEQLMKVAKTVAVVAGVGLAVSFIGRLLFTGYHSRKTMKAPGRDIRIFRDAFEGNPSKYFRDLLEL